MIKEKIVCLCDLCKKDKPREFSFFTDRMWYCDDCKAAIKEREERSRLDKARNEFYERFEA